MAKGKILIVENDNDVLESIKLLLENKGFQVLEAEDGQNAIYTLNSGDNLVNIGVILTDIQMPKVNGVEWIEYLKKHAPGIPVVAITAYPDAEMAVDLLRKGVKKYLVKPVDNEKLLEVVKELISAGK
jgi:two-component system chemotaxis response regulator CheY